MALFNEIYDLPFQNKLRDDCDTFVDKLGNDDEVTRFMWVNTSVVVKIKSIFFAGQSISCVGLGVDTDFLL